jgi:hypothetical protein
MFGSCTNEDDQDFSEFVFADAGFKYMLLKKNSLWSVMSVSFNNLPQQLLTATCCRLKKIQLKDSDEVVCSDNVRLLHWLELHSDGSTDAMEIQRRVTPQRLLLFLCRDMSITGYMMPN